MTITYRIEMILEAQSQLAALDVNRLVENKDLYIACSGRARYVKMIQHAIEEGERLLRLLAGNRYCKLRSWMIANGNFIHVSRTDSEPFVMDDKFFGETFDEAVDTL